MGLCHFKQQCLIFFSLSCATYKFSLMHQFCLLTPPIPLTMIILVACFFASSCFFIAQHSAPYRIASLTNVLYKDPFSWSDTHRSLHNPLTCFHFAHLALVLYAMPNSDPVFCFTVALWHWNLFGTKQYSIFPYSSFILSNPLNLLSMYFVFCFLMF